MSARRWLLIVIGVAVWGVGVVRFAGGDYALGGALVLGGGLCVVLAARGGGDDFAEGVINWLFFWR